MSYSENKTISSGSDSQSHISIVFRKNKKLISFEHGKFTKLQFFLYTLAYTISIDSFGAVYKVGDHRESSVLRSIIAYILVGIPLYYMQMILGQHCQMSIIYIKHLIPVGHGLIYTTLLIVYLYTIKYGIYLGDYFLYYMIAWQKNLPWMLCQNTTQINMWGKCFSGLDDNKMCAEGCLTNGTHLSAFLFFVGTYLNIEPKNVQYFTIDFPKLQRAIGLVTAWAIIFLFTALIYPRRPKILFVFVVAFYVLLILLNMGTISTTGGFMGINYLFNSQWSDFQGLETWLADVANIVVQLRLSHAFIILNASRLKTKNANNTGTITVFFCLMTFMTNILCSLFLQSCIGMIVRRSNTTLDKAVQIDVMIENERLLVLIPQSLGYLTVPQIWSQLYFMCAISTILANEITHITTIHCSIVDVWPTAQRYRNYIILGICVANCLISMSFIGESNFKVSCQFGDTTAVLLEMVSISFMSIVVFWIYGIRRLADDICFMFGSQPTKFWKITWYIMPFIVCFSTYYEYSYNMVKMFPGKRNFFVRIWLVATASPIVILVFIEIFKHMQTRNLIGLFRPTAKWGPPDVDERHKRFLFNPRTDTTYRSKTPVCQHNCLLQSKILKNLLDPEAVCTDAYLHKVERRKAKQFSV